MNYQNNGTIILSDKFLKREKRGRNEVIQNVDIPLSSTLSSGFWSPQSSFWT
jgi:hypothetical protein